MDTTSSSFSVELKAKFPIGRMVWAKYGLEKWPGFIASQITEVIQIIKNEVGEVLDGDVDNIKVWIGWYGENQLSQVSSNYPSMGMILIRIATFYRFHCKNWISLKTSRSSMFQVT